MLKKETLRLFKKQIIIFRAEKSRDLPVQECGSDCVDATAYGLLRHVNYLKELERQLLKILRNREKSISYILLSSSTSVLFFES